MHLLIRISLTSVLLVLVPSVWEPDLLISLPVISFSMGISERACVPKSVGTQQRYEEQNSSRYCNIWLWHSAAYAELEYRLDISRVTNGAHVNVWIVQNKLWDFLSQIMHWQWVYTFSHSTDTRVKL
jgi:hypothetical protein